jgi:hypothetical protein
MAFGGLFLFLKKLKKLYLGIDIYTQWVYNIDKIKEYPNTKGANDMKIWSENQETMIDKGFTYKGKHYTWDEADEVYYRDDVDDNYFMEIPEGAKIDR